MVKLAEPMAPEDGLPSWNSRPPLMKGQLCCSRNRPACGGCVKNLPSLSISISSWSFVWDWVELARELKPQD